VDFIPCSINSSCYISANAILLPDQVEKAVKPDPHPVVSNSKNQPYFQNYMPLFIMPVQSVQNSFCPQQ